MSVDKITIALAGNPNSGKTSVFNALTGARQHVGNYPGVTVEKKTGTVEHGGRRIDVVDLPGTYSLTAYSLEEVVARNYIIDEKPDVVVAVVDASNLDRNLYLAVQLMELGVPVIVALNMMDVAESRGTVIDVAKLSKLLGVPVVPTVARKSKGMPELLDTVDKFVKKGRDWQSLEISYGLDIDQAIASITADLDLDKNVWHDRSARWVAVKCMEGDEEVLKQVDRDKALAQRIRPVCKQVEDHLLATLDTHPEGVIAEHRYGYIASITRDSVTRSIQTRLDTSDKVDRVLTHRLIGPVFLLIVLYAIYEFVFWASEAPVGWLESGFGLLSDGAQAVIPEGLVQSLVVSGIIDGVGGVLGFVPLILFMFFAIAIMEDSGYLARVAYLLDRILRAVGLHGNSIMAIIVSGGISGGCAVPGVMATRTIKDPKARLATILTVSMLNCGAKLPVYAMLIAAFFADNQAGMMFTLTLIAWAMMLFAARVMRSTILKGEQSPFVMELPPYRLPTVKGLLIHTWERTWSYIKKAGTVILAVSIVIWAMMTFPSLPEDKAAQWDQRIQAAADQETQVALSAEKAQDELAHSVAGRLGKGLTYITAPLGFDWQTNVALVGGFAAKEVVVATMGMAYSMGEVDVEESESLSERLAKAPGWTPLTAFGLMIFVMIYAPCFVTVVMIRRETGKWSWALFAMAYTSVLAYVLTFVIRQGGLLLGLG